MLASDLAEPADRVFVNEGDRVARGQTLAILDTADLQAQYDSDIRNAASLDAKALQAQYQARLAIAQSPNQVTNAREALAQAQASLHQTLSDLDRDRALERQGYLSPQALQTQQTLVNSDEAAVNSDRASLDSAIVNQQINGTAQQGLQAANVASARADAASAHALAAQMAAQIAKARIVSPVAGTVVNRNLNPGEYPGSRTIFVVQQDKSVYAELNASSVGVFRIVKGSRATLTIPGDARAAYTGRVVGVLGQVQPGSTNFTVKVLVPHANGRLVAGLPVTGRIALAATTGIGIPTTAFLDDSHSTVFVVDRNGTAQVAKVVEIASDATTSIVQGLAAGTIVISNGQLGITAGQPIDQSASSSPGSGARHYQRR